MSFHQPVLLKEAIEYLNLKPGSVFVDATLGGGGHTEKIFTSTQVKQVFAFDQDEDAVKYATQRLSSFADKLEIIRSNFENLRTELALRRIKTIDGILFDPGVSSFQLDNAERGFSIDKEAPLDMRMDRQQGLSVREFVNTASAEEMARIFRLYGEEQAAYKIAQWIVSDRRTQPIETTTQLSMIIDNRMRSNPAFVMKTKMRIFQALRIYTNRELEVLGSTLKDAVNILNPNGRIVVIAYHSLEDRIVKTTFNEFARGCICPKIVQKCVCNHTPVIKIITHKPVLPDEVEAEQNSRSRSAKLRVAEKL